MDPIDGDAQTPCGCVKPHVETNFATRRDFLKRAGAGFGSLGLTGLLSQEGLLSTAAAASLQQRVVHFAPKTTSVIWLFMYGGPSAFDLFDYKPELQSNDGKTLPDQDKVKTFNTNNGALMKSPYSFKQYGESGAWVSEKFPELAQRVDDIAWIRSVHCTSNNHAPALFELNTGMTRVGFPSVGSWLTYGLGTENQNLPGFVTMYDPRGGPIAGPQNWGSGFLPSAYQATPMRSSGGAPILDLERRGDMTDGQQRAQLDLMAKLNDEHHRDHPAEADLTARIQSYELAYRMQMEAPEALDISQESEETKKLYGLDRDISRYYGTQCLMARRLVERGVRFIQLYSGGGHQQENWDAHNGLKVNHDMHCAETDAPIAGLLADLKRRGLLDQTLVIWGGEFGRMPMSQGGIGRDHNNLGFLMWMAGGGIKGGVSHGETDEIGLRAALDPVSVPDIHATILHLMGIDHERLTYLHNGRRYRLTDVSGEVLHKILA